MTDNGVRIEIRVDNLASPSGRARAVFRGDEIPNSGIQASITAVFDNLSAGFHTLSLWAMATNGGTPMGSQADPGCLITTMPSSRNSCFSE